LMVAVAAARQGSRTERGCPSRREPGSAPREPRSATREPRSATSNDARSRATVRSMALASPSDAPAWSLDEASALGLGA
jgi:hypothetical protein